MVKSKFNTRAMVTREKPYWYVPYYQAEESTRQNECLQYNNISILLLLPIIELTHMITCKPNPVGLFNLVDLFNDARIANLCLPHHNNLIAVAFVQELHYEHSLICI